MLKATKATPGTRTSVSRSLARLYEAIRTEGYTVYGPTLSASGPKAGDAPHGALTFAETQSTAELPVGLRSEWSTGQARLRADAGDLLFGILLGPTSAKSLLYPSRRCLWSGRVDGLRLKLDEPSSEPAPRRIALFGLRACDLAAIQILDRVLLGGPFPEPAYRSARENSLLVVVDCDTPHETCFCTSVGGRPHAEGGFDVRIAEIEVDGERRFVLQAGSAKGESLLNEAADGPASEADLAARDALNRRCEESVPKRFSLSGLKEAIYRSAEGSIWYDIAERCLSCGNCTLVCPTCFCSTVEDTAGLDGTVARHRVWDSCFNAEFSYIHGGSVRQSTASRYRQWLTHKLAAWQDQFETAGCVGCGRCIAWCPAGIDIAAEARRIQDADPHRDLAATAPSNRPPGDDAPEQ